MARNGRFPIVFVSLWSWVCFRRVFGEEGLEWDSEIGMGNPGRYIGVDGKGWKGGFMIPWVKF